MEIKISEKAKRQLRNIYNYFLENSTKYAEELINGFYKKLENLKRFLKYVVLSLNLSITK